MGKEGLGCMLQNRKVFTEVYLTNSFVSKEKWKNFIEMISKYNGYLKKWRIKVFLEQNKIHYILETNHVLPTMINNQEDFLLKELDHEESFTFDSSYRLPIFRDMGSNFTDIYGYDESKKNRILTCAIIEIFPLSSQKSFSSIHLYFDHHGKLEKRKGHFLPANFLSISFELNKRFFYQKVPKYLKIEKQTHLLTQTKESSILKVDTFPYLQGDYYLDQNRYRFDLHSLVLGSSGSGKASFLVCSFIVF